MRLLLKSFAKDDRGGAIMNFAASQVLFWPVFLVLLDGMVTFMAIADMHRANGVVADAIRVRNPALISPLSGHQPTSKTDFFRFYCENLVFQKNCNNIVVSITSETSNYGLPIPGTSTTAFTASAVQDWGGGGPPLYSDYKFITMIAFLNKSPFSVSYFSKYLFSNIFDSSQYLYTMPLKTANSTAFNKTISIISLLEP